MSTCSSGSAHSGCSSGSALSALQCHFTWELPHYETVMFYIRDRMEDFLSESAPWTGQNYTLQGFLQARLGNSSDALSLFHSASEALRGPGLLVNYGDLAWLHHERGEQEQSQEYLSRVEALSREYPTQGEHPEVLAEKAFSLMQFHMGQKLLAVELFEEALKQEPERVQWLSAQAITLMSTNRHSKTMDKEVVIKMKRAIDQDPDNLELRAEYLNLLVQREKSTCGREESTWGREESAWGREESACGREESAYREDNACTGAQLRAQVADLGAQLLQNPIRIHRSIRLVLELQRKAVSEDAAVGLAEKALQKCPDSRYLKACLALCLKWQMNQQRESVSQELIERTAALLREVISLYPSSCLKNEIDLANVLAKSNHSLAQADQLYQDLLRRSLDLSSKQMLYNNYAKFMHYNKEDNEKSIEYHLKAIEIPVRSYLRENSIALLQKIPAYRRDRRVEDFLRNIPES